MKQPYDSKKYRNVTKNCKFQKVLIRHQIGFGLIVPQFSPTAQISEQVLLMIIHRSVLLFLKVWTVKTVQVIWCVNWVSTNCFCPKKNYKTENINFFLLCDCKTFNFCYSMSSMAFDRKHPWLFELVAIIL